MDNSEKIRTVKNCIDNAYIGKSKLDIDPLDIHGLTTLRVKHLLNNLCSLDNASYLEVGVYQGATFINALYKNKLVQAVGIDNFSDQPHNGKHGTMYSRMKLDKNLDRFKKFLPNYLFSEQDAFKLDLGIFSKPVNVYFYDGFHSEEGHYKAFTYFNSILADRFVVVIDDWYSLIQIRKGVERAFKELNYNVLAHWELNKPQWHEGLYIGVIEK